MSRSMYAFGIRYFYWQYYKHNDNIYDKAILKAGHTKRIDPPANEGYQLKDWYIDNKYKNLKEEMFDNTICTIGSYQWDILVCKATIHYHSDHAKTLKISVENYKMYEMWKDEALTIQHLIAMMLYCNQDKLQRRFTETYRKLDVNESDDSLKERHQNYAHLGRLLRELVECFGSNAIPLVVLSKITFYHGVNGIMQFASFKARIKGPFSTSGSFAVAQSFSNNLGVVLGFTISYNWGHAFMDCVWLSDFPSEQEVFFIGGFDYIHFHSIIMPDGRNYVQYLSGMRILSESTQYMVGDTIDPHAQISQLGLQIFFRLLSNEVYTYYPNAEHSHRFEGCEEYAEQLFHNHCISLKRLILFGGRATEQAIKIFKSMFFYDCGWIKLDKLTTVFPLLTDIWLNGNKHEGAFNTLFLNLYSSSRLVGVGLKNCQFIGSSINTKELILMLENPLVCKTFIYFLREFPN
eukprot:203061_1